MSRYYRAENDIKEKIREEGERTDAVVKQVEKFAKKHGAKCAVYRTGFGDGVAGLCFPETEPDLKVWKRSKSDKTIYLPRHSSKAGKAIASELNNFFLFNFTMVAELIGMEPFKGTTWRTPGIKQIGDEFYIIVPNDVEAKGCTRISDVDYEKLASAKPKKGAKE